jgi:phosphodiesterase/alkaline phosphatase D-like protein
MSLVCRVNPNTLGRTNFFQTPPGHSDYASIQQAPGMASGIQAFRCYIQSGVTGTSSGDNPGDTTSSPNGKNRTEALIAGGQVGSSSQNFSDSANGVPGYNPQPGQTYWHRWRFRIEAGSQLPSNATYNWHLTQTNSLDSNSHYGGMSLKKDLNAMVFENPGTVWNLPMASLQMDRWYDIMWRVLWQTGSSGTHTMWVDGVQQQTATGATMAAQGVYHKFGAYRIDPGTAGHVTLWHSGLWVYTTQAELTNVIPGVTDGGTTPTPTATVTYNWVGATTPNAATVSTKFGNLGGTETARLMTSTSSAMTSPVAGPAVTVDANGYAKLPSATLANNTTYFYGVSIDGSTATQLGTFKTYPAQNVTPTTFTFGFGSCANADSAALPNLKAKNPVFFVHLGDLGYYDIATNTPASFRTAVDGVLGRTNHKSFFKDVPVHYTWSDHDWAGNDTDGSAASGPAAQSVYRQTVPHYPLGSTDGKGIYHTFVYGRVRFIMTDLRSYKSPLANTDNASKTMMGTTQKAWFKNLITNATEQLIIWCNELAWIQATTAGEDQWGGYNTERQELAAFIKASGKRLVIISGDMHALAFDSGVNSAGNIPVMQAAPLHQTASIKGGPYSTGPYPASGSAVVEQYATVTINDTSTGPLTVDYKGFDAAGTQRIAGTVTFETTTPPPPVVTPTDTLNHLVDTFSTGTVPDAVTWPITTGAPTVAGGNVVLDSGDQVTSRKIYDSVGQETRFVNVVPAVGAATNLRLGDAGPPLDAAGRYVEFEVTADNTAFVTRVVDGATVDTSPQSSYVAGTDFRIVVLNGTQVAFQTTDIGYTVPLPGDWSLIWEDAFAGTAWTIMQPSNGWATRNITTATANASRTGGVASLQLSSTTSGAALISGGGNAPGSGDPTYRVKVGDYVEARLLYPTSNGSLFTNWLSFLAGGTTPTVNGEHDVAEVISQSLTVQYSSPAGTLSQGAPSGSWGDAYHSYGLYRKQNTAEVYWDGDLVASYPTNDPGTDLDVALVAGRQVANTTTGAPGALRAEYVRLYRPS